MLIRSIAVRWSRGHVMRRTLGGKRQKHTYRCSLVNILDDPVSRIGTGEEVPSQEEVVSRLRNQIGDARKRVSKISFTTRHLGRVTMFVETRT
jgi:hypothetical protein